MFSLLNPLHVLFMNDETETRVVCHLDAVAEHDVLVLAVVRLLLPDVLGLLQDPLHRLLLPLPPIAVLLELGADGYPGTEDGTEDTA